MTSNSQKTSTGNSNELSSLSLSAETNVKSSSWLSRLPGFEQTDLNALVGRQRLSQALDLEQKPDNRYLRLSLYFLGGATALFIPLAALTPLTQVVEASGQVVPEGSVNIIQHLEGGIVSKVNILDGQKVKKGQKMV